MATSASRSALNALCRSLCAATGAEAVAVLVRSGPVFALRAASPQFAASGGRGHFAARLVDDRALAAQLAANRPIRIEPARLGLIAAFVTLHPIRASGGPTIGAFLLLEAGPRRIGTRKRAAIASAGAIAAPLLRDRPRHPAPAELPAFPGFDLWTPAAGGLAAPLDTQPAGQQPGGQALAPRAAAQHLIAASLASRDGRGGSRDGRGGKGILLLDIDRFRAINEALGAAMGDAVLATAAARLGACLGDEDHLLRLDGDRFLIVAGAEPRAIRGLARRLRAAIARPLEIAGRGVVMRASIGLVVATRSAMSPGALLLAADTALRRAKADGGDRTEIHEARRHHALLDRSRLEFDLRHALENDELSLVFQPYRTLASGRVAGAEALLRWLHPVRGPVAPVSFIPLAEASGLIQPIGRWALATACRAAAAWPADVALAVNVSPVQFHTPGFVEEVDAVLLETGFDPARLELEITEAVLMRDDPETTARLRLLIARGIRIALDDFGTGYSALAYLSRLPHHRIKLDKSFVHDLARPATAGLIRAITALSRAGGIAVTAEGVESADQLAAVAELGFTHVQGYATGAPASDSTALVREMLQAGSRCQPG